MPTPTRQITGTFKDSHLQPAAGKIVKFTAQTYRTDTVNKIRIDLNAVEVTLDSNGQIPTSPQFTLVCTDATGVAPTPVAYRVVEKFGSRATYWIDVPTGVGALDMADIAPLADPPAQPDVYASLEAMEAGDAATLTAAEAYTDAHSGGGSFPASATGWLHDDGTGTRVWSTPTAAQVGADTAAARDTAITTATTLLATTTALTSEAATARAAETANANAIAAEATARSNADAAEVIARNAAIATAVANLINGAPGALDTLKELADAINDDASFAASVTTALAGKQPLDSDLTAIAALTTTAFGRAFLAMADAAATKTALAIATGDVSGLGTAATHAATDFADATATTSALAGKAPLASPTFTGDPKAPTPSAGDNDTSVATTAFVTGAISTQHTTDNGLYVPLTQRAAANGVATLDSSGLVPVNQLPTSTAPTIRSTTGAPTVLTTDIVGDFAFDATAGIMYGPLATSGSLVAGDNWIAGANGESAPLNYVSAASEPQPLTGCLGATVPRNVVNNATLTAPATGIIRVAGRWFYAGQVIGHLDWLSGTTAAVTPTHSYMLIANSSGVVLASTADNLTLALPASTVFNWAIATVAGGAGSSYTIPTTGFYYLGVSVSAATVPTYSGTGLGITALTGAAPIASAVVTGASATPPAVGTTMTIGGAQGQVPWFAAFT